MSPPEAPSDRFSSTGQLAQLWLGLLGPAVVWLTQFELNYLLVPWVCAHGHREVLAVVSVVALACAGGLGLLAWTNWRRAGQHWPGEQSDTATRTRFLAVLGLLVSGLFFLLIAAQGIAVWFINPCRQ